VANGETGLGDRFHSHVVPSMKPPEPQDIYYFSRYRVFWSNYRNKLETTTSCEADQDQRLAGASPNFLSLPYFFILFSLLFTCTAEICSGIRPCMASPAMVLVELFSG
jgi:hypothetical protein